MHLMAWTPPKPAETYDALVKQFRALCAFTASIEAQLRHYQMDGHRETQARAQLDGDRVGQRTESDLRDVNPFFARTVA
jgi:hypothetical protein